MIKKKKKKKKKNKFLQILRSCVCMRNPFLHHELPNVPTLNDLEVGDMLIYPVAGHVIMIVDKVVNAQGENLFILHKGIHLPKVSILLKNLNDRKLNPWYQLEMGAPHWKFPRIVSVKWNLFVLNDSTTAYRTELHNLAMNIVGKICSLRGLNF